jgi:serine/threonine protein phosphatase PrpC
MGNRLCLVKTAYYSPCAYISPNLKSTKHLNEWRYRNGVGDDRPPFFRSGAIQQLTHDDTHVGWLLRNGKINERQARSHPRRNLLQKALGGGNQFVTPQVGAVACEAGDTILLCTDGLVEGLHDCHLEEFLRAPEVARPGANPADRLVEESLARNGRDNTTALVIRVV